MSVVITEDDFDIAAEHDKLKAASVGAIVTFTGTGAGSWRERSDRRDDPRALSGDDRV
jgi:molybdopterin synthase catalytic subunit